MKQILTLSLVLWLWNLHSQSTVTYTVDEDFTTGTMLSGIGDVGDIYPLEDGGFFLSGTFNPEVGGDDNSPFERGLAMLTSSGNLHPDWGSGGVGWGLELFDHQGGYLIPAGGQTLTKVEYTGESWYDTQGDFWGDYFLFGEWGSGWDNPYNVASTWDIFIQEDQSVLIGGAIATDTLQPGLFRHLMRLLPDGSHDDSFPIIEAVPQDFNSYISKIEKASDGSWYVSGWFEGINGHYSPHVAHLTEDFEVDTNFVSPLLYAPNFNTSHAQMRYLDAQDRIWVSGQRVFLEQNPMDTLHLLRILPDGNLDASFQPRKVKSEFPSEWSGSTSMIFTIEEHNFEPGHYFLAGVFNSYDDTLVNGITVVDDQGYIQENYFQGDGASENQYHLDNPNLYNRPGVLAIEQLPDGGLVLGGGFSEFMGVERYHLVKLNQGTVSTNDQERKESRFRIYPNPAREQITVQVISAPLNDRIKSIQILDLSGRTVAKSPWSNGVFDVSALADGLYLLQVFQNGKPVSSERLVVQR